MRLLRAILLVATLCGLLTPAGAETAIPLLKTRVTDLTRTLSASETKELESAMQDVQARTGAQLAILMVATTQPESIEQYSIRVVEQWKLGSKSKEDGLLLLVAKDDHKARIEVGYGLEGVVPDILAGRLVNEVMTPRFKRGDYAGGLLAAVAGLGKLIEGKKLVATPTPTPEPAAKAEATETRRIPRAMGSGGVEDLTETLSDEEFIALNKELDDFYRNDHTKPAFVVVVPSLAGENIDAFTAEVLATWGKEDNLDVDRSILLLMARDEARAAIVAGAGLGSRILPGTREHLVNDVIEPLLRKGELVNAIHAGVRGVEEIVDGAVNNKTRGERVIEHLASWPIWLLLVLVAIGTAVRWVLGPLFGATVMGGSVGGFAWFIAGQDLTVGFQAAVITFILVLVGLANWLSFFLEGALSGGGGSGGSSGGFSGGGGGFGGGGASGSW